MLDARQYINSSVAVRLSELSNAIEYSSIAEHNTHVVQLRSGIFFVSTEEAAEREIQFGSRLVVVRGETFENNSWN